MTTGSVHASAQAIEELEAGCARIARTVRDVLDSVNRELSQVQEAMVERRHELRREISGIEDEIRFAGEYDDTEDARRRLEEAHDALAAITRRARRLDEAASSYRSCASKLERLADEDSVRARSYLRSAASNLQAYRRADFTATDTRLSERAGPVTTTPATTDGAIRQVIRQATFASAIPLTPSIRGVNESWVLRNGVRVIFKPISGENTSALPDGVPPGTQHFREKAASVVDELLDLRLVPTTEVITHADRHGSAQLWKEGFVTAYEACKSGLLDEHGYLDSLTERQRNDWQLLDELIGNSDRHLNNWMVRQHENGGVDIALIDNGHSFPEGACESLIEHPSRQSMIEPDTIEKLARFLAMEAEWRGRFKGISSKAIDLMCERARTMVRTGRWLSSNVI